ncbi:hypothetical protein U9M48_037969 [Paspalum notatum var. saurae]|uniref:Integrase catalytic domain-containing protein n=1 Tax=Paspalum notatum var. saurae TaxID=547442 RepID=A0AAQ3UKY9_PASNO
MVGNGYCLPVTSVGDAGSLGSFRLPNVLVAPHMVHNLLSICQFTADNSCTVEFDSSSLTVKDSASQRPLLQCDSQGPLYTLRLPPSAASPSPSSSSAAFIATTSSTTWHRRFGHLGRNVLAQLSRSADLPCTQAPDEHLCHVCLLGCHVRLPFSASSSHADRLFDLVHCDLWTSPILSVSSYKYYLVVVDDFSHYSWTFPLRFKSEAFSTLSHFFAWVSTQFGLTIKAVQCDNGREFDNNTSRSFFLTRDVQLRMSCPYTSAQNGKAERMICTTNDVMRTLLFQASLPACFWAESLHTATYLINRLPSTASPASTRHHALFGTPPRYDHLHVFGCACYPNTSATAPHKLAPRSTRCVFLGYSPDHKGYRCFDLTSRRVLISRHVVFDESDFSFSSTTTPASDLELESLFLTDQVVQPPLSERSAGPLPVCLSDALAPFPVVPAAPRAAPASPAAPRAAPESPATPRVALEAPSSSATPRAAPEASLSPVGPRAAPVPPLRYAQPVHVYQRRTVVSPAPTPPLPVSPVPAPSTSPPAGPPEPPRHPHLAARVESKVYHPPVLERDPRHLHPMVTRWAAGVFGLRPS